jgi:hypothetical protein
MKIYNYTVVDLGDESLTKTWFYLRQAMLKLDLVRVGDIVPGRCMKDGCGCLIKFQLRTIASHIYCPKCSGIKTTSVKTI